MKMIDYKILLREYIRATYKRHGTFEDLGEFLVLPREWGYPDGHNAVIELQIEVLKNSNKLSQKIHDLGTLV